MKAVIWTLGTPEYRSQIPIEFAFYKSSHSDRWECFLLWDREKRGKRLNPEECLGEFPSFERAKRSAMSFLKRHMPMRVKREPEYHQEIIH